MQTVATDLLPLTGAQLGIWFDERLSEGERLAYVMADCLEISGPLDEALLLTAMSRVLDEAECARARIVEEDGRPFQRIVPMPELPVSVIDLSWREDARAEADRLMRHDLAIPFDLSACPLLRIMLLRLSEQDNLLYLAMHHLLGDGYSRNAVYRRLEEAYTALETRGELSSEGRLPGLALLIREERRYLESDAVNRDRRFWEGLLDKSAARPLSLAHGPVTAATSLARTTTILESEQAHVLKAAASEAGITWPTYVVAATASYVAKANRRPDVLLTVPMAARVTATARSVPGMVANYPPFPAWCGQSTTLGQLLSETSGTLARALRHQRYPAERIRGFLGWPTVGRQSFGPFVNVLPQQPQLRLGRCRATLRNLSTGIVDDLMITVLDGADGSIELHLNGNPALYGEAELSAHADRFARWLCTLATLSPGTPLGRVDYATEPERAAARTMSAGLRCDSSEDPVAALRRFARSTPGAIAVHDGVAGASYSSLASYAHRTAGELAAAGVRRGDVVGILAEPGIEYTAALLAVLEAGAAWLALDLHAPQARVAGLLADSGARHLLVDAHGAGPAEQVSGELRRGDRPVLVPLHGGWTAEAVHPPEAGVPEFTPDDLAYVCYTSGSTGRPKGAMVCRGGLANHLAAKVEDLGLGPADRVMHNAPVTFDVAVWQMLCALTVGGTTRVVPHEVATDPDALFGVAAAEGVTVLEVVPTLLRAALDLWEGPGGAPPRLPALRWLMVTGEALPPDLCARWWRLVPSVPLVNAYGPTECSDDVAHALLRSGKISGPRVPIGGPLRNTVLHVLGDDLRAVPLGHVGELYVGGAGVGRGYLGDPVKTAGSFVADPSPDAESGGRVYRTGDHVVRRADGQLEFIERRDDQVKIRGQRIELGEVEAALRGLPEIGDAVVIPSLAGEGHTRLIAYYTSSGDAGAAMVREALAQILPAAMVPSLLVPMAELPLTTHGKIDRAALPEPGTAPAPHGSAPIAVPSEPSVLRLLCAGFAQLLDLSEVPPDGDFFQLGGDSITAIQLVARMRAQGVLLTPREVFDQRTPAALASSARTGEVLASAASSQDAGAGEVPLTPILDQLREDLVRLNGPAARYSQFVLLRTPKELSHAELVLLLQALLDHHDMLRLRIREPAPGMWALRVGAPGTVRAEGLVEVDEETEDCDIEARAWEAAGRLDPRAGVMMHAVFLRRPCLLLLVAHHSVIDGVSWRVLSSDLASGWNRIVEGCPPAPDAVGTSYRSFARLQHERARTAALLGEFPYWQGQCAPSAAALPGGETLDPKADTHSTAGALRLELPAEHTTRLLTTVTTALHAEINEVLLGALAHALSRWHSGFTADGRPDGAVRVEVEGHGREQLSADVDLARTVGWFTTAFPVVLEAADDLAESVACARDRLRRVPRHGIGYGLLRHLNTQTSRLLAACPPPVIGFNYLGRFRAGRETEPWTAAPGAPTIGTAFDPAMPLRHALAVTPVTQERPEGPVLVADWLWAGRLIPEEHARDLAEEWFRCLVRLAEGADGLEVGGLVPADLAPLEVEQAELGVWQRAAAHKGAALVDVLPLTAFQRGLLFRSVLAAENGRGDPAHVARDTYSLQVAAEFEGELEAGRLEGALAAVLTRHPQLAAGFRSRSGWNGEPVALLHTGLRVPLERADLSRLPEREREPEIERLAARHRLVPFDLAEPPLMRWLLADLGGGRSALVWTLHHILVDGWSMPLVVRELLTFYREGTAAGDLPVPVPFRRYVQWLADRDRETAREAWCAALLGASAPSMLFPDAPARLGESRSFTDSFTREETNALQRFAVEHGLTLNTLVQGAWAVLLARLLGRREALFGTVVSTRPPELPGAEQIVGPLLNTVPVLVKLDPDETAVAFLRRLQDEQQALREHAWLGPLEMLGGNPQLVAVGEPFDTVLVFENFPGGVVPEPGGGGPVIATASARDSRHHPLSAVVEPGERLCIRLDYAPELLDADRTSELAALFRASLLEFMLSPDEPLTGTDQLPTGETAEPRERPLGAATDSVTETELCTVFAEALGCESVTPRDNFFLLGGDSITAIRLVGCARERGMVLTVRDVFANPTPATLAACAGTDRSARTVTPTVPEGPLVDLSAEEADELEAATELETS